VLLFERGLPCVNNISSPTAEFAAAEPDQRALLYLHAQAAAYDLADDRGALGPSESNPSPRLAAADCAPDGTQRSGLSAGANSLWQAHVARDGPMADDRHLSHTALRDSRAV
jgi:hypothetical protein